MKLTPFLPLAFAGAFLMAGASARAETYAFMVGIADYPDVLDSSGNRARDEAGNVVDMDLSGPVNDVNALKDLLVNKYGVQPDNIRTAVNSGAGKDGFLAGMRWLIGVAKPGDQVMFYYSGHGGQVEDKDEEDGTEEVICLHDDTLVSGDLFNSVSRDLAGKGVHASFLFDSCYSGGMSRDVFSFDGKSGAAKQKFAVAAAIARMKKVPEIEVAGIRAMAKGAPASDGSYLFLMAGQEDQPTTDLDFKDENTPDHGLFTLVLTILLDADPAASVTDIVESMRVFLESKGFAQKPDFEASSPERAAQPLLAKK